jgi:phospholipase/lecithinase/hemolysin
MITSTILIDFSILLKTKKFLQRLVVSMLFIGMSTTVWASPYKALYVFGDSLSDTDNFLTSLVLPTPPYSPGRVSNGLVWVEYLASQLGLVYNPKTNFAWAGAQTDASDDFGLLPGLLAQVDYCIENYPADPDGLYFLWIGANDLFDGVDEPETTVTTAVNNIMTAVEQLIQFGAEHIILLNVPDLGQTPNVRGKNLQTELTAISVAFNQALAERLNQLEKRIVLIDMFFFIHEVIANPSTYGFQNISEPCFVEDNEQVCDDPDSYLFWDNKHPTTMAHQAIANYVSKAVAVPTYHVTEKLLTIPSVNVVTQTEMVGVFEAELRWIEGTTPPVFILVEAQEIVAHNVLTEPVTFGLETGTLHIPLVEVGEIYYRAKLILEPETLQNFVVTELVSH